MSRMRGQIWKLERNRCSWISRAPPRKLFPWPPVVLSDNNSATMIGVSRLGTNREMFFAITRETRGIEAVGGLHRHKELLLPSASCMEREKARRLAALDACAFPYVAHRAFLSRKYWLNVRH